MHQPLPHDSASKHVQGTAQYIDDIREPEGTLHLAVGGSARARGRLVSLDVSAVRAVPGVVAVITARDVPARNDIAPAFGDEPLFADDSVLFLGQPVFAVVAQTRDDRAAVRDARHHGDRARDAERDRRGRAGARRDGSARLRVRTRRPAAAIASSPRRLEGSLRIGGQEHFYLEGQIAMAVPGEDGDIHVYSSTQHPTEVQHVVARVLGIPDAYVTCETRRMGGGFGGKESQATQWAVMAALAARVTGQPCKIRLDRDDDFILTGKRHDFRCDWTIGFDEDGRHPQASSSTTSPVAAARRTCPAVSSTARCSTPTTPIGCRTSGCRRAG